MNLEEEFHKDMLRLYKRAKDECGYIASRFLQMISEKGGFVTAKELISKNNETYGFERLWELKRLDLSVEALVLKYKYRNLFTSEERKTCRDRLKKYDYNI